VGAKVNGRIVQLKQALRNGVWWVLTQANHLPSKDWAGGELACPQ
jgi:(p)ppGpp synthase/HD superfamily hydrolase